MGEPDLAVLAGFTHIFAAMATGYVSTTGFPTIDDLFSRGGMASLLTTVWLVLGGAVLFAAILERAGFLERLLLPVVERARSRGRLILAVNGSGIGLNVVRRPICRRRAAGPHVPRRVRAARAGAAGALACRRGLRHGHVRARAVEHLRRVHFGRAVFDRVVPAVLFLQLLSPMLDVAYGFVGFKVPTIDKSPPVPGAKDATAQAEAR